MIDWILQELIDFGFAPDAAAFTANLIALALIALAAWIANWIAKTVIVRAVAYLIRRSEVAWGDVVLERKVFTRLSHIAPAIVITLLAPIVYTQDPAWSEFLTKAVNVYLIVIFLLVIDAILNSSVDIYRRASTTRSVPIKGFVQGFKLVVNLLGLIFILGLTLGKSPLYFLSGLGALTAVILFVFRDAILGFVAGIQISVNQMVRVGDWIEMPKYGADGDIIDVSLTTVKVQNWDRTISTVPTYALISDPVKNWRGMQESGGRRIKRSLFIDVNTVRFVDDRLIEHFKTIQLLGPYLDEKVREIAAWNQEHKINPSVLANGRRLTNLGTFRAYCIAYLRAHPQIRQDMTFLVRQLHPSDHGIPIEIYVFTSDIRWPVYEGIQADIFDHLLAVIPEFGLRIFQSPSGNDIRNLARTAPG